MEVDGGDNVDEIVELLSIWEVDTDIAADCGGTSAADTGVDTDRVGDDTTPNVDFWAVADLDSSLAGNADFITWKMNKRAFMNMHRSSLNLKNKDL